MYNSNNSFNNYTKDQYESVSISRSYVASVFSWMFAALAITAGFAYYFSTSETFLNLMFSTSAGIVSMSPFGWVIMFAPLGFVLLMSFGYNRLSGTALTFLFIIYSVIMGMSLSFIFLVYSLGSIYVTFAITAGTFGFMALLGYTTKIDLTKFGSIMLMGLIGIIIACLVNFFLRSAMMDYVISVIGVLVFTGLTAYDVQKIKRIGAGIELGSESARKMAIMGALTLYLDFINLFLFLLRLFGSRR
jgi:FtsH-binding integral membrane protein